MRTRFAPSPTGPLHLGHAYAAFLAFDTARHGNGTFLLRVEDIDQSRCRAHWEKQIFDDLRWLGLDWPQPVMLQSERMPSYDAALDQLWSQGLLYPCTCCRRDIHEAASAPQEGSAKIGPDGVVYPGTCRPEHRSHGPRPTDQNLRLNIRLALQAIDKVKLRFIEVGESDNGTTGTIQISSRELTDQIGDFVVARKDMQTSYHLSVTVDDAEQGITHVTRGQDLFEATKIHVLLQELLGLPTPIYHHHPLIRDENGKRLAKRDDARAIAKYREDGATPQDIRKLAAP